MTKLTWVLAAPRHSSTVGVTERLSDLKDLLLSALPSSTSAYATLCPPDQYGSQVVAPNGKPVLPELVLEVELSDRYPPLDQVHAELADRWEVVQGWRVRPTLIYDSTVHPPVMEPSTSPALLVFIERLDGTTPEHFDRNWYIHAGHFDGQEAESDRSRAERQREETESPRLYRQNRVVEPITGTQWLVHGYTQLQLGFFMPGPAPEPYDRPRGEAPFDKWPPRYLQGLDYHLF